MNFEELAAAVCQVSLTYDTRRNAVGRSNFNRGLGRIPVEISLEDGDGRRQEKSALFELMQVVHIVYA